MGQHLDEKRFHIINRAVKLALKENKYNARKLGKALHVSHGTITRVRHAKTWSGFLALKASRQTSPKESKVEKELATNLDRLEQAPTRGEMKEEFRARDSRWTAQHDIVKDGKRIARQARTTARVSLFLSGIALVLAILALAR